MAKTDNLTDFLTDVADAIREKKGTTDKINPQDFSEEIRGIESGGISTSEWNDVNFYDYDGTILYSYTWDEFVAKNEMPPLPTHHEGLTCQEWNYTLEEVLEQGGRCDVGATYIPSNGRTQIYIEVTSNFEISFAITPTVANDVIIYWGDGTYDSLPEILAYTINHIYNIKGNYCIEIANTNKITIVFKTNSKIYRNIHFGNLIYLGAHALSKISVDKMSLSKTTTTAGQSFNYTDCRHITLPKGINTPIHYLQWITAKTVSLPNNIQRFHDNFFIGASNLLYLHTPSSISTALTSWGTELGQSLRKISVSKANTVFYEQNNCMIEKSTKRLVKGTSYSTIPDDIITIDYCAFKGCAVLQLILIPNSVTKLETYAFGGCSSLTSINIPNSVTSIGNYAFLNCTGLTLFNFEEISKVDTIGLYAFQYCTSLTEFNMPDSVITLELCAFYGCTKLLKITMSANVSKINTYTFYQCSACECFDFSKCNSIPLLVTTNAFTLTKDTSKIVVPDNLYKDWIAASNWSNYASRIINKTTWEEQNQ